MMKRPAKPSLYGQLFGTPGNTLVTLLFSVAIIFALWTIFRWAFVNSLWTESYDGECGSVTGAC